MAVETNYVERKIGLSEMETLMIKSRNAQLRHKALQDALAGPIALPADLEALIPVDDDGTVRDACKTVMRRKLEKQADKELADAKAAIVGLAEKDTYKRILTDVKTEATKSSAHAGLNDVADAILADLEVMTTAVNAK